MKRSALFLCLLIPVVGHAQTAFDPGSLDVIVMNERKASAGKFLIKRPENVQDYDVKWYRCAWVIDPAVREIAGSVTTLFVPPADLDTLVLDLSMSLIVDSVVHDHLSVSWFHASDQLVIHLPVSVPANMADSVTVYYHGVPPDDGFGTFVQTMHNEVPVIWTLSEPYGASTWWPCKNSLTDKADSLDVFIRTPSTYKAASNGILLSEIPSGDQITCHWKHRYPIAAYLVCLAVTDYAVFTQEVVRETDTLNIVNFVYPEDSASIVPQSAVIVPMIRLFDSLFGIYPFQQEKYGQAEFSWGGGMEHQTMTFITVFQYELMAHELAHQWFGDMVTCGTWTDIWLNEGFATYLSGLCYENLDPQYWKRFREVRVKNIISQPGGSVYCTDTTSIDRIFDGRLSYAKGAMILHMLRRIMGDDSFFAGLNSYLADPDLRFGFARTANLQSHLENVYGSDLSWYFDDWYTGEGYPSYQIHWNQPGDTAIFTVNQTQSHPSVSFFELPLYLEFKNTTSDTMIRVFNTYSGQTFSLPLTFKADSLIIDPNFEIISGNNTVVAITEQLPFSRLQVIPNPASGRVHFRLDDRYANHTGTLKIINPYGLILNKLIIPPGQAIFTVDASRYAPGFYFYIFTQDGVQNVGKFILLKDGNDR